MAGLPSHSRIGSLIAATILLVSLVPQSVAANDQPLLAGLGCIGHTRELGNTGMCTHGADPVPDFIRERGAPARVSTLSPRSNATSAVGCDGDGTSGKRVQALYAYVSGRPNRRDTWLGSFRVWASNVDDMFKSSAVETGGSRRLRWVTNGSCLLDVPAVAVTPAAETSFGTLISELSAMGYNSDERKYLVWIDSERTNTSGCGVATVWGDDRPTGNNNNTRRSYARIDYQCWDFAEQHEMMHTLGAVQTTAPNATPGLHCSDEYDQMCYKDSASVVIRSVCPQRYERLFDCNHDDYFSTSPNPGSYLATHWNAANSDWLINAPAPPAAPGNDAFGAATALAGPSGSLTGTTLGATEEPGEAAALGTASPIDSVWYRWTLAQDGLLLVDTCTSALDTNVGAWTGATLASLTLVAANDDDPSTQCGGASRLEIDVAAGATYQFSVDGRGTAEGPFRLNWQFVPPGADLVAPIVQQARSTFSTPQTLGTAVRTLVSWPAATDESGIATYELQRRRGSRAWVTVPVAAPTSTSAEAILATGYGYSFRVRATDGAGNTGPWTTATTGRIVVLQETDATISYSGRFKRSALSGASGGYVRRTGTTGRQATLSFSGRAVGLVTTLGPDRGIAEVRLDGGTWQQIDLYATVQGTRRVIWAAGPDNGAHTLQVRVTGARDGSSSGSRVDIDAFLVWR